MKKDQLFTGLPDNLELTQSPEMSPSPLGEYVLGDMSGDLAAVRDGQMSYDELRSKQQDLMAQAQLEISTNNDPSTAEVTQLDLVFMLGAYLPLGDDAYRAAPPQLLGLLKQQADRFGLPERMDYELVIDVNAREYEEHGHMRTFLDGDDALQERDFYLGHYYSEPHVKAAAYDLRSAVENPAGVNGDAVMESAAGSMKTFREYMAKYMHLSKNAFDKMRPYLASYPDGTRNASGAFMAGVQLAELAVHAPTEGQGVYLDESMDYFPRWAKPTLAEWRESSARGNNVLDLVMQGDLPLSADGAENLSDMLEEFIKFRTAHLAATRKQIPEAFGDRPSPVSRKQLAEFGEPDIMAEGEKGTAGFDIINVLGGAAHRLVAAKQKLAEM